MSNKHLFGRASPVAPATDTFNEAGGPAYALSAEHALAQYAVTGTFHGTFYASDQEQLAKVQSLAQQVRPELVAKTAIYCRKRGRMKDVPAYLVAWLAGRDVGLMLRVFPRVIDDARMLRSFVAIVRSGVTGRKSFGSAPKRALRGWFAARSPEAIFRQSIGQSPSMSDVIKMVRPPPRNDKGEADAVREALYGYLIGKSVDHSKLPPLAQAFEAWKRNGDEPLPDVPFEMLTALPLRAAHWTDLAKRMTFNQLRQNLNTLHRHRVFTDPAMIDLVAERVSDSEAIARSRALPYQLLATFRAIQGLPAPIVAAVARAVELSVANVPEVQGSVALCPDVSGSMRSAVTGDRGSATTQVRCIDVAALLTSALLRKNPHATVLPFAGDVVRLPRPILGLDSVVSNTNLLASLPSGSTDCSAPLRWLNARCDAPDLVIVISDNESWADFRPRSPNGGTAMAAEWHRLQQRNERAKLVLVDLQPYGTTQIDARERRDVLEIGGFSDAVFDVIASFVNDPTDKTGFLGEIEAISLESP